ncbi:hypothetical protein H0H92_002528 [Tricholoma furcatifolium]|nr:hypothetical protein H0H92_002528 [Tricholoma furcatifolium]
MIPGHRVPPGLYYLARLFLPWTITYFTVSVLLRESIRLFGAPIPGWAIGVSAILCRPVYLVIMHIWKTCITVVEVRRTGSLVVPQVYDPLPFGLSLVSAMVKSFKTGFPGDILQEWRLQYGNTYILNLVGEPRIFTYEPEHVKAILATQFELFDKGRLALYSLTACLG